MREESVTVGSQVNEDLRVVDVTDLKKLFNANRINIFKEIRKHKEGVTMEELIKYTGFTRKSVTEAVNFLHEINTIKKRRVKNAGHGVKLLLSAPDKIIITVG